MGGSQRTGVVEGVGRPPAATPRLPDLAGLRWLRLVQRGTRLRPVRGRRRFLGRVGRRRSRLPGCREAWCGPVPVGRPLRSWWRSPVRTTWRRIPQGGDSPHQDGAARLPAHLETTGWCVERVVTAFFRSAVVSAPPRPRGGGAGGYWSWRSVVRSPRYAASACCRSAAASSTRWAMAPLAAGFPSRSTVNVSCRAAAAEWVVIARSNHVAAGSPGRLLIP